MKRSLISALLFLALGAASSAAQGVVVDQGRFVVLVGGREVGAEEFVIRRAGLGSGDAIFASGVVTRRVGAETQEVRPLLRATPLEGSAESYQVTVSGRDAADIRMARSGRRYVATIRTAAGDEDREFQARPDTYVLELDVAHHYYFLRSMREGREGHVLVPRTRSQLTILAGAAVTEELRLGPNVVSARKVVFTVDGGETRLVWFDRQGRVLRVEIPASRYVAERTDLVG
jgi:hypothetical protein